MEILSGARDHGKIVQDVILESSAAFLVLLILFKWPSRAFKCAIPGPKNFQAVALCPQCKDCILRAMWLRTNFTVVFYEDRVN